MPNGGNAASRTIGGSDIAEKIALLEFGFGEAEEAGSVSEALVAKPVARNAIDVAPIAVFEGVVNRADGDGTTRQDGLSIVRATEDENALSLEDGAHRDFEDRNAGVNGININAVGVIAFIKEGVRFNEFVAEFVVSDIDRVVILAVHLRFEGGEEVGSRGSAVDDGVQFLAEDVDVLGEKVNIDGVLTSPWDDDGIIDDGEDFNADAFGLRGAAIAGEGATIFGGAHLTGFPIVGFDAVHEDLSVAVDFGFVCILVGNSASVGFDNALEDVLQESLGDEGLRADAVDFGGVIGRENLFDSFDSHNLSPFIVCLY